MTTKPTLIRVVLYWDEIKWVAQGLELDIAVSGADSASARQNFSAACKLHAELRKQRFGDAWHGLTQAPKQFFDMWEKADWLASQQEHTDGCEVDYRLAA